jgi:hypothetical protein
MLTICCKTVKDCACRCLQWTVCSAVRPRASRAYMTALATVALRCIDRDFASLTPRCRTSCSVPTTPMSTTLQRLGGVAGERKTSCRTLRLRQRCDARRRYRNRISALRKRNFTGMEDTALALAYMELIAQQSHVDGNAPRLVASTLQSSKCELMLFSTPAALILRLR